MNENKENDLFKNDFVLAILLVANAVLERGTKSYMKNCIGANCSMQYDSVDPPPKTNADRIRSMSDEELAIWINDVTENALSVLALGSNKQTKSIFYWLDWLKQEIN